MNLELERTERGTDETRINGDLRASADTHELPVLEESQKLGLHREGQFTQFVQKERAPRGASTFPRTRSVAPVNAPRSCPNSSLSRAIRVSRRN